MITVFCDQMSSSLIDIHRRFEDGAASTLRAELLYFENVAVP
jgi:hypothetical protein